MKRLEKQRAISLRLQGRSYNEIRRILNIPSKGTLSYWFKNLALPPNAQKRLAKHIASAEKRGLLRFNRERTKNILAENKQVRRAARREIGGLSQRELLLIGAALYWGEGAKRIRQESPAVVLANSDPCLIAVFMRFIREILEVSEERIRAGIHIHPNVTSEKARRFWAKVTKLPADRFYIIRQISRASRFKRPRRTLPYGTVSLRVNKRVLAYKMSGYLEGLRDIA